jgi:hypothetical protein
LILRYSLHGASEEDLVAQAIDLLRRLGYAVERSGIWETVAEFCRRTGISGRTLRRRLQRRKFMPPVDLDEGPTGRLIRLRATSHFEAWLRG